MWKLIKKSDESEVKVGDIVETFRGDKVLVTSIGYSPSKICIQEINHQNPRARVDSREFFANVVGCKLVEVEDDG